MKEIKSIQAAKRSIFPILLFLAALSGFIEVTGTSGNASGLMHPMMNPENYTDHVMCENCGMNRNMWARTRHEFSNSTGTHYTCSIHCVADLSKKAADQPKDVKVALYTEPSREVMAEDAVYVVGSSAPGTMTMNSKLAFASEEEARNFMAENGGELKNFNEAFQMATEQLPMARKKIAEKRIKTGKIVLPTENDRCQVCGMMPARFPDFRSQILTKDKRTIHFCSTSCLIKFKTDPLKYMDPVPQTMMTWVTVFPDGTFDYAGGLYYVVGSPQMGSMGPEALPFRERATAQAFAGKNGGTVVTFDELTPEKIGSMKMKMK